MALLRTRFYPNGIVKFKNTQTVIKKQLQIAFYFCVVQVENFKLLEHTGPEVIKPR